MKRDLLIGFAVAAATLTAAYALSFLDDPGSVGRELATALGLCVTALPTGVAAGVVSASWQPAAVAAAASAGIQFLVLATYCAFGWNGSWDLPAIVSFAIVLQALALVGSGGLVGVLRRPGMRPD